MRIARALAALQKHIVLTRPVPTSFAKALNDFQQAGDSLIDLERAKQQHETYASTIASIPEVSRVIAMPSLDDLPDSVFVEDVLLVVGKTAIVTRPGASSRRAEASATYDWLCKHFADLDLERLDNFSTETDITLDGGDVMQVNDTVFVGQSTRTNEAALTALQAALPSQMVTPIPVPSSTLHLKSIVTWLGPSLGYVVHGTPEGKHVADLVCRVVPGVVTFVASALTANILRIGNTVLYNGQGVDLKASVQASLEKQMKGDAPGLQAGLEALGATTWCGVDECAGEIAKADGALTCCSVVLASRHM
jgi:dimethylargininase